MNKVRLAGKFENLDFLTIEQTVLNFLYSTHRSTGDGLSPIDCDSSKWKLML